MRHFTFWHSIVSTALLLLVETVCVTLYPSATAWIVCGFSIVGAAGNLFVATEAVEEIHRLRHMIVILVAVIFEFIAFFAFQYYFLIAHDTLAFPTTSYDIASVVLQSLMVFVLNPLSIPGDTAGKILLSINTLASVGLVLFILQNIAQFRHRDDVVR